MVTPCVPALGALLVGVLAGGAVVFAVMDSMHKPTVLFLTEERQKLQELTEAYKHNEERLENLVTHLRAQIQKAEQETQDCRDAVSGLETKVQPHSVQSHDAHQIAAGSQACVWYLYKANHFCQEGIWDFGDKSMSQCQESARSQGKVYLSYRPNNHNCAPSSVCNPIASDGGQHIYRCGQAVTSTGEGDAEHQAAGHASGEQDAQVVDVARDLSQKWVKMVMQWTLVEVDTFCDNGIELEDGVYTLLECEIKVEGDDRCGELFYSNMDSTGDRCRCVPKGQSCKQRESRSGNNVYQRPARYVALSGDCREHTIQRNDHITLQQCMQLCDETPTCEGFSWHDGWSRCLPKSAVCDNPIPDAAWVFYKRKVLRDDKRNALDKKGNDKGKSKGNPDGGKGKGKGKDDDEDEWESPEAEHDWQPDPGSDSERKAKGKEKGKEKGRDKGKDRGKGRNAGEVKVFLQMDLDKDSRINLEEVDSYQELLRQRKEEMMRTAPSEVEKAFDGFEKFLMATHDQKSWFNSKDRDQDGVLSLEEFRSGFVHNKREKKKINKFNKYDADGDGKLSLEEIKRFRAQDARHYHRIFDRNSDGYITMREFRNSSHEL